MGSETIQLSRMTTHEVAEAIAPTWERRRAQIEGFVAPVRDWLLRELRACEGDTVLELAAGTGDTGFDAAAIVGESGRLISSDFSPAMLGAARRRGAERGVENVEYRLIDAERIELGTDSVDGVLCRFAYMLMDDPADAVAESARVLRARGRLALAVWGAPERNPFFAIIAGILVKRSHVPPPEPPPAPGIFSMANPERTTQLLHDAGFADARVQEIPVRFAVPDVEEYLALIADTAGPLGLAVRSLSAPDLRDVRAHVEDEFSRFAIGDGFELPGVAVCAVAR
jgi:ubiquinone/menaquinone biosynthesis C-methylase UbiE